MSYTKRALTAASALLFGAPSALAGNVTLQGNCVKIGTSDRGTIGSGGNTAPGILYDSTCTGTFNPSYDYLTPGTPFEGWTVKGLDASGAILFNNSNNNTGGYGQLNPVTGTNVDYSGVSYRGVTYDNRAVWSGSTSNFNIENDVRFNDNQHFVDINTRLEFLTNVSKLYFGRFTDPDARAAAGDSSSTLNTRGYAGGVPATNVVLSEALASKYALGLFTAASNSNTGVSASWTNDPVNYYNGVNNGNGDYTIGLAFEFNGINAGDIVDIQYAYIFGPSAFTAASTAVADGAGGATPTSFTVTDAGSASSPTPTAPTVTGTSTTNSVTTSTSVTTRGETSEVTRSVSSLDADGNPIVRTYTDTVLTTTPTVTVTTTTTPVTTTTYSDGTTTTSSGTPVVTTSSTDGTPSTNITASTLFSTAVTRTVTTSADTPSSKTETRTVLRDAIDTDANGNPRVRTYSDTVLDTTPVITTVTSVTPVTTVYYADGTTSVTNGTTTTSTVSVDGVKTSSVISSALQSTAVTKPVVTTATENSAVTATRTVTRTVEDVDADGNPRTQTLVDTVVDTTPIVTTITTTTPVTTTTLADGTISSAPSGTPVVVSTPVEGAVTSTVTGTTVSAVAVTRNVTTSEDAYSSRTATRTLTRTQTDTDSEGNPRVRVYTDTILDTTPVTTTTTTVTPVTTTTLADGTVTSTNGVPVVTTASVDGTKISAVTETALNSTTITKDVVTSSTSTSTATATRTVTRTETDTDDKGNPRTKTYDDTVVDTTPVTTVTTVVTPTTTTYYADGTTSVVEGTPVASTSSTNGTTTSVVAETKLQSTAVTTQSIAQSSAPSTTLPVLKTKLTEHKASESKGVQKIARKHTETTTTPMVKTTVTTPVTTTLYADGTETIANGTPVSTYELWNDVAVRDYYDALFGRVDQLEVLDGLNDGINGLLNHEGSKPSAERLRVFDTNRFVQSYTDTGYTADTKIFGGGFEFDMTKGWTVGFQYNNINVNLQGVDSKAQQTKDHFGIFSTLHGNTLTLNTNAAIANSKYNYTRNVENVFNNAGETTGSEWWVSNKLYWNLAKWIKPFIGFTMQNVNRNAYTETGSIQSARKVDAFDQTTYVGEVGAKLETRFGGKKKDLFGVSVEGGFATDSSYGVTAAVDYKEMVVIESAHTLNQGVTNNSIAAKLKFKF